MRAPRHVPLLGALAVAACLSLAPGARAEPGVDEPPLPGTPRPLTLPTIEETTLANGVRLIVAERHALPLVSVALHLRPGSAADPAGRQGLGDLTAALRAKGAMRGGRLVGATELARQAEALGSGLSTGSGWGGNLVSMTVATPQLAAATALVVDVMRHPVLAADELDRLRAQTADGLKFSQSDPMALAGQVAQRASWGASVYGGSTTAASLARIGLADVRALHQRQSRPEAATLVMSGDITLAQARALAEPLLADWQAPAEPAPTVRAEPPQPQTPATVLVNLAGAGQSGVVVTAPSVPADSPERRVAQVASAVLGGGFSSRLNTEIRIKRGLSYGASAGASLQPPGGVLTASAQTQHASAAEVVRLMHEALARLASEAPSTDEVAARQAALVGGFARRIESTGGLANAVLNEVEAQRPLSNLSRVVPELLAVTPEQVRDHARRYWRPEALRTIVVGDLVAAGASLKAVDPQALTLNADALELGSATLRK